ncbi:MULTISPECIES: 4-oxalomesaconate tautomerase [unclassified Mycolicibacterium]|uniref:4-oxalomesaconate tautomerase n=1 Tax=unclassified Mycolicibacterium TaxID=2636767 RepID=UPI002ED9B326
MLETQGIPCIWMRGGTSKGAFFLADDLPLDPAQRNDVLLRILGTPDPLQIDGIGGATSLTSKVAVISPSLLPDIDIDYLFLQAGVDEPSISERQNCGNLLAGVGQFALETGLVQSTGNSCTVRINMANTGTVATSTFPVRNGKPVYRGTMTIDGVPGSAAPVSLAFPQVSGPDAAALLPTGRVRDTIDGIEVTCVDNGMPVVVVEASAFGITGYETPTELAANVDLLQHVDVIRCAAAELMGLGDVQQSSIPKTVLVAPAREGGQLSTRSFIPVAPHTSLGVFAAISTVTAVMVPGSVGHALTRDWPPEMRCVSVEHPSGRLMVDVDLDLTAATPLVRAAGVVRTARKLFSGRVFPRA